MENSTQLDSAHGVSLVWSVFFVAAAAMIAAGAFSLLPVVRISEKSLPEEARVALVVLIMALGFSGVLVSTLLNLPDRLRRTALVLFAVALLCSGFVALVGWFAVSGASSRWF
jgi:uncharacterized membrane protein